MPSWDHEGLIELFRCDPRLAAELLASSLGVALPAYTDASVEPNTMAELQPAELHADLVIVLRAGAKPLLAIVVEVQRTIDPDKPFAWPAYVAWLRRKLRAEACVLVITQARRSRPGRRSPSCSVPAAVCRRSSWRRAPCP